MDIKIKIASALQEQLRLPDSIIVQGTTVGECIEDLGRTYPQIRNWYEDQDGLLRKFILLNNEFTLAPTPINLSKSVNPGDELTIMAVFAGG